MNSNQFHKRYIDEAYLEEKSKAGFNPWNVLVEEALIQEGLKSVDSDDEPDDVDQAPKEEAPQEQAAQPQQEGVPQEEDGLLSPEELQQMAQALQSGEMTEEDLKGLMDQGKINNIDVQMIQESMPSPEEEQAQQINQVQEMVVRFNVYDKIMALDAKLDLFIENFHDGGSDFYGEVQQIHEFVKVLNTLIFNLEINLVYQMYASLETQLIELFETYKDNPEAFAGDEGKEQ